MDKTLDAIIHSVQKNYPHLFQDGDTIIDYYFINCSNATEIPIKDLDVLPAYLLANNIKDFTLIVVFNNNVIGYRLDI